MVSTRSGRSTASGKNDAVDNTRKSGRPSTKEVDPQLDNFPEEEQENDRGVVNQSPAKPSLAKVALSPAAATPINAAYAIRETLIKSTYKSIEVTHSTLECASPVKEAVAAVAQLALPADDDSQEEEEAYQTEDELVQKAAPARLGAKGWAKGIGLGFLVPAFLTATLLAAACTTPYLERRLPGQLQPLVSTLRNTGGHYTSTIHNATSSAIHGAKVHTQQHLHNLLGSFGPVAEQIKTRVVQTYHNMRSSMPPAVQNLLPQHSSAPSSNFQNVLPLDQFQSILSSDPDCNSAVADFWHTAPEQVSRKHKAVATLLVCRSAGECSEAGESLSSMVQPASCLKTLSGVYFATPDSAGQLQQELVEFLTSCPHGVVLLTWPDMLSLRSLSVINNAISEAGHLTNHGRKVETSRALYVLLYEKAGKSSNARFESEAKKSLGEAISAVQQAAGVEDTTATVRAFTRRIDAVYPVKEVVLPAPKVLIVEETSDEKDA